MRQPGSDAPLPAFVAVLSVGVGVAAMTLGAPFGRPLGMRGILMLAETLLLVPAALALIVFGRPLAGGLGVSALPARRAATALLAGAALWIASLGLFELQYSVWPPPAGYLEAFRALHDALRPRGALDALVSVAAIAVFPAVCEELLFRGVVLPALRPRLSTWGAVVGAALLFGLIHVDVVGESVVLYRVPFAIAVGLGLGALRVGSRSVVAPALAHAVLNTVTFAAAPFTDPPEAGLPDPEPLKGALFLAVGVVLAAVAIRATAVDGPSERV